MRSDSPMSTVLRKISTDEKYSVSLLIAMNGYVTLANNIALLIIFHNNYIYGMEQLTITGYSTALFSTWYFVDELSILFDAGDGVTAGLLQKAGKVKHVFTSHADRDHLTGLLQFNQLNARANGPAIYYPKDSGSFTALQAFSNQFDPHVSRVAWQPVTPQSEIKLKDGIVVKPILNGHIPALPGVVKSVGYSVEQVKRKLKPELAYLTGMEIKKIREERGEDSTTIEVRTNIVSYSGDTPVEDADRWKDTNILIHESTFLSGGEDAPTAHSNKHSTLEQVIEMISATNIKQLILGHFSSRYTNGEITSAVKILCEKYAVNIPVYCVLPGDVQRDILRGERVNK